METTSRSALVIHRDDASLVLAVADEPEQLDRMLQQFGARVIELVRSGAIAMTV
jgi:acetolactate synthase small subunit